MFRRIVPIALLTALAGAWSAPARAQAPPADASANVSWVTTLPEPGVVSVRPRGEHLFVSTVTGLSVYDVSDARAPVRVGRLELPVAQNEDVDLAGDVLLMSDEPAAGAARLHIIDISDPTRPTVMSTYDTWARGLVDEMLGDPTRKRRRGGIGHTATCLQDCRYAWLAGSDAGIEVVDLRDPRNPRFAGRFRSRETASGIGTHDVQLDQTGLAWVAGGGGTAAYDVRDPVRPKLVFRTGARAKGPSLADAFEKQNDGNGLNDLLHHNSLRLPQGSLGDGSAPDPAAPSDVVAITEEDLYRPRCRGAGQFQLWQIGRGGFLRDLDTWRVERDPGARVACSAHYFDEEDGLVAQGWFEQGVRLLDVRTPTDIRQVGYWVPRGGMAWGAIFAPTDPTAQTVYGVDHARGIDVLVVDRGRMDTVARKAPKRPRARNTSVFTDDGRDVARPGGKLTLSVFVLSEGRPPAAGARAVVQLPEQAEYVRVTRNGKLSRRTRTVSFPVRTKRQMTRGAVEVTLRDDAAPGPLLFETRLVGAQGESMLLDDRHVDRDVISARRKRSKGRGRAASAAIGWLCRLGSPAEARARASTRPEPPPGAAAAWLAP